MFHQPLLTTAAPSWLYSLAVQETIMISRREFLKTSSLAAASLPLAGCVARPLPVTSPYASAIPAVPADLLVNDVHSQLNATRVDSIV
ncbi:MAG: twin-arginine translocation signal domain-containing protein, partial [Acidobacteriota bacterium]